MTLADTTRELAQARAATNTLLDVLNAILAVNQGRIVVPGEYVLASKRRLVHVTEKQAPHRYVIELDGVEPEPERHRALRRLAALGLRRG